MSNTYNRSPEMCRNKPVDKLLSINDVCHILKKHRCTINRWVKQGWIIAPVKINGRTKGWRLTEFNQWFENLN